MAVLAGLHVPGLMDKDSSESIMNVLVWGVLLLGSIALFVVWGLSNAYT